MYSVDRNIDMSPLPIYFPSPIFLREGKKKGRVKEIEKEERKEVERRKETKKKGEA